MSSPSSDFGPWMNLCQYQHAKQVCNTFCVNLLNRINEQYDDATANELERRFLNSIRTGDPKKFKRVINKIIESKR